MLIAFMATVPLSAMESNQSFWASAWKQSKDLVQYAVNGVTQCNADLTQNQRYAIAATFGLAAVGAGYAWFTKKAKSQEPARLKKTVSFALEKNQVKAIPTRAQALAESNNTNELQPQLKKPVVRNVNVVAFVLFVKNLHEALEQDQKTVSKLINSLTLFRSLKSFELNTIKVWNKNFIDLNLKEFSNCQAIYKSVVISHDAKTLEELQKLQRDLVALAKELAAFIQRFKNNSKE